MRTILGQFTDLLSAKLLKFLHGHYINSCCYLGTGHVRNTRGNYCFGVVGILAFQNRIFAKIILILAGIVVAMLYKIRNSP